MGHIGMLDEEHYTSFCCSIFLLSLHKKQRPVLRSGRRQANSDVADNETRAHDQGHT